MTLKGKIAFSSGRSADYDIWCLDLQNASLSQITTGGDMNLFPALSADGRFIAYTSTSVDLIPSLFVEEISGSQKIQLTKGIFCTHPTFSADAKNIYFAGNAEDKQQIGIYKIEIDSKKISKVIDLKGNDYSPSVSACGSRLIFCAELDSRNSEIQELNLSDGSIRTIASHPAIDRQARFSPDGEKICFVSHREEYDHDLYKQLENQLKQAAAARDMQQVDALIQQILNLEGDSEICIIDKNGNNLRSLTKNRGSDCEPCWSPCGNYICYCASDQGENGASRLKIISVADGSELQLPLDRSRLIGEIEADTALNRSIFQKIVPDWIEKKLVSACFWGQEKSPSWSI